MRYLYFLHGLRKEMVAIKPIKIAYYSRYYNIQNFVDNYLPNVDTYKVGNNGDSSLPKGHKCILILPTYEPEYLEPAYMFLESNKDNVVGIVGSGDRNYGGLYLYSVFEMADEFGIPVLGGFENMGMSNDADSVMSLIDSLQSGLPPLVTDTEFFDIEVDRQNYYKHKRASGLTWYNPIKKK